ncbi:MAG TPA: tail fiber domain-containing protein [Verrucomicrobiae bacterium]|nr:tail fiber domain-containing protein [Verrucomicrobiae bacterium]
MKTIIKSLLFACFIFHSSFCLGYTINNISIGTDLNSAAWAKVNNNNNNFVAWLNADDLTNGYFFGVLTNIAPLMTNALPTLLDQSNRLNTVSNYFMIVSNNFVTVSNRVTAGTFANGAHITGNLADSGTFSSDAGSFTSDGSGNVTAQTFTPVSDRALKENITPLTPGASLGLALALTNYQWNFRARTNLVTTTGTSATTNLIEKIIPASGEQMGPMAQDWHTVTGLDDGRHISLTAMQGLLLGAIQDLAARQPVAGTVSHATDSTSGHGAGLIRWDANYLYLSVGTNQWKRAALATW